MLRMTAFSIILAIFLAGCSGQEQPSADPTTITPTTPVSGDSTSTLTPTIAAPLTEVIEPTLTPITAVVTDELIPQGLGPPHLSLTPTTSPVAIPRDTSNSVEITIDPEIQYQVFHGWEAVSQSGRVDCPGFTLYQDALLDQAVNDLGITRLRLEIPSGLENPSGNGFGYEAINDDADPYHINESGFNLKRLSGTLDNVIVPMREKLAARGEELWINATLVDFSGKKPGAWEHRDHPEEYAEFVLAVYEFMQTNYGFTPDSWEVILEPDTSANWLGRQIGPVIAAAGKRLAENGFTPRFVAPSVTNLMNGRGHINEMMATQGIKPWLYEFSYHRYGGGIQELLEGIAAISKEYNVPTAMLEHVGADYQELYQDLTWANVSAWEQYTLAYCKGDNGGAYYWIDISKPDKPVINKGERTRYLRQFFHFIRPGDIRIDAVSLDPSYRPVAFMDGNGKVVIVIIADAPGVLNISGLPVGEYGVNYTSKEKYAEEIGPIESKDGSIFVNLPEVGIYSLYPFDQAFP